MTNSRRSKSAWLMAAATAVALVAGVPAMADDDPSSYYGMGPGMMGQGYGPGMMQGYGQGYGMGPGMMGQGYGPGMMGQGYGPGMMGQGYGPGMMQGYGQGYGMGQGYGPGMMGQGYGQGYGMAPGMRGQGYGPCGPTSAKLEKSLTVEDVTKYLEARLSRWGNDRLKVGKVESKDDKTITGEIVTKDGSLVDKFAFDKTTGRRERVK